MAYRQSLLHAAPTRPHPATTRRTGDRGYTFTEVVITITLMGIVVVGVLAGVRTLILASRTNYDASRIETVLLNASDRVTRAVDMVCDYDHEYLDPAAVGAGEGWGPDNIDATVYVLTGNPLSPGGSSWQPQQCGSSAALGPFDVQKIVITATAPTSGIRRSIDVYKSKVS